MAASIFDTLRYARRLKEAGVAPEQAEAMADALAEEFVPSLATKADLQAAIADFERRIILANLAIAGLLFAALRVFG